MGDGIVTGEKEVNLINDVWIPAILADGSKCKISPAQIAEIDNPVIELAAPRADFQGALYQFLIGLLQTSFAPEDHDEWLEYLETPPTVNLLRDAMSSITTAFEIDISKGPAFMQELDDFGEEDKDDCPIEDLVGENTRKKNSDLFVKQGVITQVDPYWAALSLFNLQTSGVLAWGQHRVGLRGNGPLTSILLASEEDAQLWKSLWLNVIDKENGDLIPGDWKKKKINDVFPWMTKTRVSPNKEKTIPMDVNPLQHFWPMPRRIRLKIEPVEGVCDISGESIDYGVKSFKRINHGVYYTENWLHPLTPYTSPTDKKNFPSVISGKDVSETFKDWPLIVIGYGEPSNRSMPAMCIQLFHSHRSMDIDIADVNVWCFGYRANNANVYGYVDGKVPFLHISQEKIDVFLSWVSLLIESTINVNESLCEAVSYAWYGIDESKKKRNKHAISKIKKSPAIEGDLYGVLQDDFYSMLFSMSETVKHRNQMLPAHAERWLSSLWKAQQEVFVKWSLDGEQDEKKYRQIILAKKSMEKLFNSNKVIKSLKQIAASETEAA
jgi:CRISPR system Cascade subunit CasA